MKLLLADDDEDQLSLRSLTLAKVGHKIWTAIDPKTALQLASEHQPDAVVTDLRMPSQADGLRLIRNLRKLNSTLRLIVLTGADPKHFETLPERKLVEAVMTKGNASRQLTEHLSECGPFNLRRILAAEGQIVLEVKVIPRAAKSEVVEFLEDGALKVRLAAIPENGCANEELLALLADHFQVRKEAIELTSGETSQRKRLRIRGPKAT